MTSATDVLIVGGGPAGLAAAIALRQKGLECVVVDSRAPGIDKACGEGLMPDSRAALARLGVSPSEADGYLLRGIRFSNASDCVDADFPDGLGIGVRRPRLHRLMAARAEQAGAHLLWKSRVELPGNPSACDAEERRIATVSSAMVNGQQLSFRWLIGADGQSSGVRRWAGLDQFRKRSVRYGFRTHYRVLPWSEYVEIHWARGGQLYVTPVAPDCVCAVYITHDHRCDRAALLDDFPRIAGYLKGAEIISQRRGAVSATCKLQSVASGATALVGDASGSADSITGQGLAMSFRQAHALADAIACGSLAPYRRAHEEIGRLPHAMGALMLTLDRWPVLESRAMRALAAKPDLFAELLSLHMGQQNLASLLLRRAPGFGWSLLTRGAQTGTL